MSHTTETKNAYFIHNGGYDGDVTIYLKTGNEKLDGASLNIDMDDLKEFFAEYLRQRTISAIENMDDDDILRNFVLYGAIENGLNL